MVFASHGKCHVLVKYRTSKSILTWIASIQHNQDVDTSIGTNAPGLQQGSPATSLKAGEFSRENKGGMRVANEKAGEQSNAKYRRGITRDELDREYLELTWEEE